MLPLIFKLYGAYATWWLWRLNEIRPELYLSLAWFVLVGGGYAAIIWGGRNEGPRPA